jgi:signal peptide peptidase SppA
MARPGIRMADAEGVTVRGRVAIVEMIGPVMHYGGGLMAWLFGWPSAEGMMMEIQAAQDNPAVETIVLHIDSPGGQVGGIAELAGHIRNYVTKPVVAYVGDMAASAAYWIASAADMIVAAPTAEIGSIGVVFTMRRRSDNSIEIVSSVSPKKRVDPETDEGRQAIQARADALAEVFVSQVAENRKLSADQVTSIGGDVVIAAAAVKMGLADEIGSLEQVIAGLNNNSFNVKGAVTMNLEKLKADHPELYAQVMDAGRAEVQANMDAALAQAETDTTDAAAAARTETIEMVEVVLRKDAKEKLEAVLAAGLTPAQVKVSMTLFGAGDAGGQTQGGTTPANVTRQQILAGITDTAKKPAPPVDDAGGDPDPAAEFMALVDAHQKTNNCKRSASIEAMSAAHPEIYKGWLAAQQKK